MRLSSLMPVNLLVILEPRQTGQISSCKGWLKGYVQLWLPNPCFKYTLGVLSRLGRIFSLTSKSITPNTQGEKISTRPLTKEDLPVCAFSLLRALSRILPFASQVAHSTARHLPCTENRLHNRLRTSSGRLLLCICFGGFAFQTNYRAHNGDTHSQKLLKLNRPMQSRILCKDKAFTA